MKGIDWPSVALERKREAARIGDPLMHNWFRHKIGAARKAAAPGREAEAEARVIREEVERRTKLILKHPEWAEIWGVDIRWTNWRVQRYDSFMIIDTRDDVMISVASADWWVRKGWEWRVAGSARGPVMLVGRFDPWEAGERHRIVGIARSRGAAPTASTLALLGGRTVVIDRHSWPELQPYADSGEDVPAELLERVAIHSS